MSTCKGYCSRRDVASSCGVQTALFSWTRCRSQSISLISNSAESGSTEQPQERTMTHSHVTAPTQFVEAAGVRYAYRRFGPAEGVPLLFLQHFTGTMDFWDPAVVDGFARERPVVLFDNAGVSRSGGATPETVHTMADDAAAFIAALELTQVDLLGF